MGFDNVHGWMVDSVPEPVTRMVDVGDHQIAVIDGTDGKSGPAVVFLHGILASAHLWPILIRDTPLDRYRWISVGLPGHYPSVAPKSFQREELSESFFARMVLEPVQAIFGDEPVHLVGWSTGGYSALMTAAESPERVASVVSLSGFARGAWEHFLGHLQVVSRSWWRSWLFPWGVWYVGISPRMFRGFQWLLSIKRPPRTELMREVHEIGFRDYGRIDAYAIREMLAGIMPIDSTPCLAAIQSPVLILAGERDKIILPREARHLHEQIPNSTLIEQPGVGHMFHREGLESTLGHLDNWIARQSVP